MLSQVGLDGGGTLRKSRSKKMKEKEKDKDEKKKNRKRDAKSDVEEDGKEEESEGEEELDVVALMRSNFDALANFTPSVVTGANGKASISVKVPHNLTRYRYFFTLQI